MLSIDTDSDFIRPEFLNILFFQQKNLIVFPYVDLKHLHVLELFTTGYNVVDLESTALHNLKEIIEFESNNSYSQNPTFYFIYNVGREKVKELMELDGIRCVINSNENIGNLANGSKFIFFNKKNNQFLNYDLTASDLEFENLLINSSQDEDILQENIQKIKIAATRIFKQLNQSSTIENLPDILVEYDKKYWHSILNFMSFYYDINIPDISEMKFKFRKELKDFSNEYEVLISTNRALGKEFIQLLHDYRSKKVNAAHLELEELYNPQKLYNYLRNHHWKEGIPEDFIQEWSQMKISTYQLTELDQIDFENILNQLGISQLSPQIKDSATNINNSNKVIKKVPSIYTSWSNFRTWILTQLEGLETYVNDLIRVSENPNLKIEKIKSKKVKEILKAAEIMYHGFKKLTEKIDASPIVVQYAKGFETILDEEISSNFSSLKEKYRNDYFNRKTTQEFHDKYSNLMLDKSISLGTWVKIIRDINKPQNHPELIEFSNNLKTTFNDTTLQRIKRACEIMADIRNPRTHNKTCTIEEIIKLRKKIIQVLNSMIKLFYNKSSEELLKLQIKKTSQYKSWLLQKLNGIEQLLENL
ncbi:MAG: hypothetical protein ACFFCY_05135 [Promethearchaeota archaeon]